MFNHPGKKLQSLAAVIFAIIIIGFVITGFVLGSSAGNVIVSVILMGIVGLLIGWLSSIAMYAFGTLVNDVEEIKYMLQRKDAQ